MSTCRKSGLCKACELIRAVAKPLVEKFFDGVRADPST